MRTSLTFGFFLMAFFIAGVVCGKSPGGGTSAAGNTDKHENAQNSEGEEVAQENEEEEEEEEELEAPLLTCALFNDNAACNAVCSIMASIYAEPISSGTCIEQNCNCDIPSNATPEDFWKLKFDSQDILQEINKNDDLSEKVFDILKTPYQTPQQTKQILESLSLLTSEQLESLRVKNQDTQKLFTKEGAPNTVAVQKYVAEKLKSLQTPVEGKDYKKQLLKALDSTDEDTSDHILHAIRRSKNKLLNEFLDSYVNDHKIEESPIESDENESMIDILDIAMINEIIKPASRKAPARAHGKASPRPKSTKPEKNLLKNQSTASSSSGKTSVNDKRAKNTNVKIDKNLYTLEGFDKTEVARFKAGNKKKYWDNCWKVPNVYEVCTTRYSYVEYLSWYNKKQQISVDMRKFNNGNVGQTWKFVDGGFELQRKASGEIIQHWDLPNGSHWEYIRSPTGDVSQHWNGEEDWKSVEYYKSFMDSWCTENGAYMNIGEENCIMY